MNTCDFEETKHQALLKFEELCKEPDKWELTLDCAGQMRGFYLYPDLRLNKYEIYFGHEFRITCGGFVLLQMKASLKRTQSNKYYKLAKGLMDHRRCNLLRYAMKDNAPPIEPKTVTFLRPVEEPTLWSKFKTWMRKD